MYAAHAAKRPVLILITVRSYDGQRSLLNTKHICHLETELWMWTNGIIYVTLFFNNMLKREEMENVYLEIYSFHTQTNTPSSAFNIYTLRYDQRHT